MRSPFHARGSYLRQSSNTCKAKDKVHDFVVIDDDSDVIILDSPKVVKKNKDPGIARERFRWPLDGIISIDDDDDNNGDDDDDVAPGINGGRNEELDSDSSSSASEVLQSATQLDDEDECQVLQEKASAFRFSKCKQTFSKASFRSHNGLFAGSQRYSSEGECSDCEVIEVCAAKRCSFWEKAALGKKKYHSDKCHWKEKHTTGHFDLNQSVELEHATQSDDVKEDASSPLNNEHVDRESVSAFNGTGRDANAACCHQGPALNVEDILNGKRAAVGESSPIPVFNDSSWKANSQCSDGTHSEEDPNSDCNNGGQRNAGTFFEPFHCESSSPAEADLTNDSDDRCSGKPESRYEQASFGRNNQGSFSSIDAGNNYVKEATQMANFNEKESEVFEVPLRGCLWSSKAAPVVGIAAPGRGKSNSCPADNSVDPLFGLSEDTMRSGQLNEVDNENGKSYYAAEQQTWIDSVLSTSGLATDFKSMPTDGEGLIDREKFKETEEFKKAAEAEWASRQKELEIQAEEARKQRKKRKAETLRLLDMERRQKQRVEEMREAQKKDKENMNLREQLRLEVQRELKVLEATCFDMASLLRRLGITVGGGAFPLSEEVRAAYKRALLKYHPDRTSGAHLRQQVEAEEKFKLICRMKDIFFVTSRG